MTEKQPNYLVFINRDDEIIATMPNAVEKVVQKKLYPVTGFQGVAFKSGSTFKILSEGNPRGFILESQWINIYIGEMSNPLRISRDGEILNQATYSAADLPYLSAKYGIGQNTPQTHVNYYYNETKRTCANTNMTSLKR